MAVAVHLDRHLLTMLKITLITLGNKMPTWVEQAVKEYTKRLQDGTPCRPTQGPRRARRTKRLLGQSRTHPL